MGALAAIGTVVAIGVAQRRAVSVAPCFRLCRARHLRGDPGFLREQRLGDRAGRRPRRRARVLGLRTRQARARHRELLGSTGPGRRTLAARSRELTDAPSSLDAAAHGGHRLALALLLLAGRRLARAARRRRRSRRSSPGFRTFHRARWPRLPPRRIVCGALAAITARGQGLRRVSHSDPVRPDRPALATSSASRARPHDLLAGRAERLPRPPALGSGAGTYDLYWTRDRPFGTGARDAHSLYVETLAELGPLGLALLLAAPRRRSPRCGSRGTGRSCGARRAYAVYLVHAAADWDWEIPTLTLTALVCGALLAASDPRLARIRATTSSDRSRRRRGRRRGRRQRGNDAAAKAGALLGDGRNREAVQAAERASRWAPWAAEPWRVRADADRALGNMQAARRSAANVDAKDPRTWTGWFQLAYLTTGSRARGGVARVRAAESARASLPASVLPPDR